MLTFLAEYLGKEYKGLFYHIYSEEDYIGETNASKESRYVNMGKKYSIWRFPGKSLIFTKELLQVIGKSYIAGVDSAFAVIHDNIDCYTAI